MHRRSFLTALSSLPFLGWLKPEPAEKTRSLATYELRGNVLHLQQWENIPADQLPCVIPLCDDDISTDMIDIEYVPVIGCGECGQLTSTDALWKDGKCDCGHQFFYYTGVTPADSAAGT